LILFSKKRWLAFFFIFVLIDLLTKKLAIFYLEPIVSYSSNYPYGGIPIFHKFLGGIDFSLGFVQNKGAAFGIFSNSFWWLFSFRTLLIAWLFGWFFFKDQKNEAPWAWVLILAGAFGNWLDMVFFGSVIDFLNFHFYEYPFPLFNFADSFITIGATLLIVGEFFKSSSLKKKN
jgi:signal peptidase II